MTITRREAVARATKSRTYPQGMCYRWTREMFGLPAVGDRDGDGDADAVDGWRAAKHRHPGDRTPPGGVPVFWSGGSKGHGHAALTTFDGRVRSIDTGPSGFGTVGTVDLGWFERHWGLTYLGWSEDLGGQRIPTGAPAPTPQPPINYRDFPTADTVAWNMHVGARRGVREALDALAASGARLIGLMECFGHWPVIRAWAKEHGWSIVTGEGDPGAGSAFLVRHGSGHTAGGTITIPGRWIGPKGKIINGRVLVWEKAIVDGRPTLSVLKHQVWNPKLNFVMKVRIERKVRRLATENASWDFFLHQDANESASARTPYSPLGTANKIGGRIIPTGAPVDLVTFRPATEPTSAAKRQSTPEPVAVKGDRYDSDHPAVGTRNGARR